VLTALAAAQVQVAQLKVQPRMALPHFCHALASLTSLQELCITQTTPTDEAEALPAAVLTAARRLQGLRKLELSSVRPEDAPRLPPGLQELDVTWAPCGADTLADLSHMSALQECTWRAVKKCRRMRVLLPAQLVHANLHSPVAVAPGLSLQSAVLAVSCDESLEVLQDLTPLPLLQSLRVSVLADSKPLTHAALSDALAAIGQLTSLTELCLDATAPAAVELDSIDIGLGSTLEELKQLRRLELDLGPCVRVRDDLLVVSKLTGLTSLVLKGQDVDDFLACAVVLNLSRLQKLVLEGAAVQTAAVLPLLSKLTDLRHLELVLGDTADVGMAEGMQLQTLTQLTRLHLSGDSVVGVSELSGALRRHLPRLQEITFWRTYA
jgi:hypothetical protein